MQGLQQRNPIDLQIIEAECDFHEEDMEEDPANNPKVSDVHENEVKKINNEEFFLRMKK